MRYAVLIVLFLFSCASTKKVATLTDSTKQSDQKINTEEKVSVLTTDDLTEVITERITKTTIPVTDESGKVFSQETETTDRTIERFQKKTEQKQEELKKDESQSITEDTLSESIDKETVGQDLPKIAESVSKGIFQSIFGRSISIFLTGLAIVIVSVIWIKFLNRGKSPQSKNPSD